MARRFKLKIYRIFQSCSSKDTSEDIIPTKHVPPIPIKTSHKLNTTTKCHVSTALIDCGLRAHAKPTASDDEYSSIATPKIQWDKEPKWHVVEMTPPHSIMHNDDSVPPAPPPTAEKKRRRRAKKRNSVSRFRVSNSSADSVMFSSEGFVDGGDDDEETETLVSSKNFSTDTSLDFKLKNMTITEMPPKLRLKKKVNGRVKPRRSFSSMRMMCRSPPEILESPARLSVFQKMIPCTVEIDGKVRESFAVVKKSEDPYDDFKKSMMEMILEKPMFDEKDLEQLLHCFLSLNSKEHRAVIVEAFSDIWDALFSRRSCSIRI